MPFTSKIWNSLEKTKIDVFFKGMPLKAQGQTIHEFLKSAPNLFSSDFQFPLAVLKKSALENNLHRMATYCRDIEASLAPHVKTTMSPQIARMQLERGAWALTVANFSQARVFLKFGFNRIVIANEIVDRDTIQQIALINLTNKGEVIFYLDSVEGLELIQNSLRESSDAQIHILFEIGVHGGRGGIRDIKELATLVKKVNADSRLLIRGVSGFEGAVPGGNRSKEGIQIVREFAAKIVEAARLVSPYIKGRETILSAGGSAYFDIMAEEFRKFGTGSRILLRSGAYITHDHGLYESIYPFSQSGSSKNFLPAMELWAQVLSQPESGLAILNLGKRDVGNDINNPIPIMNYRGTFNEIIARVDQLNDQHSYMRFDLDQDISIGDVVCLGISHPCTTFDKWKLIPLVDDDYRVTDLIHTYF
jgi:D-serine deaminase-like pyridoxal phosphate-dependent protein